MISKKLLQAYIACIYDLADQALREMEPKRRGRPLGSKNKPEETVKRGRGRPKKVQQ